MKTLRRLVKISGNKYRVISKLFRKRRRLIRVCVDKMCNSQFWSASADFSLVCELAQYLPNCLFSIVCSGTPSAPTDLQVRKVTKSGVKLSWTAPTDNGGTPITGYVVRFWPPDNGAFRVVAATTGDEETFVVTGMLEAPSGQFDVAAINAKGAGQWSQRVDAASLEEQNAPPRLFRPSDAANPRSEGVAGPESIEYQVGFSPAPNVTGICRLILLVFTPEDECGKH
ncbi:hypothetical protein T265_12305 [Opisthorchis viverrini]|uniref:Fibronectin type-III domain-containing protein n=1 Tax=Opisthorchis viverrini TaxID=6198 RepID=A0A074YYR0_OPIVI|nr:hypothetical protein T265_12305 [Opisthorchis viverrini]KER18332.1 hypothetical protein T265_12305 [Opisthorchis viverrini]